VQVGDVVNPDAVRYGKPLEGLRVLAFEHMQSLPYATQLLARLGADVVKIEPPGRGDAGRASRPAITEPDGDVVGATFLRNNLSKRSVTIDLKHPEGRDLALRLAGHFDIVAENGRPGVMARLRLAYEDVAAFHPRCIYVSVSGYGQSTASPYRDRPAFAPVVEAMTGAYEMRRRGDDAPVIAPMGALGDSASGVFAALGALAAVFHRDRTGEGQHVDVAMLDATIALTDIITNLWSLGLDAGNPGPVIMNPFRAADGWFVLQVIREHQFERLAETIGRADWLDDPRFATREGWVAHLDSDIRPAIEAWAAARSNQEVCDVLTAAGVAAGPCLTAAEVVADEHVAARHMLVEIPRHDGVAQPVLTPGNPIKFSKAAEGPDTRPPPLGHDTEAVLRAELGLDDVELARLRTGGVI
jgi:crotonobetainyl-CoA:carnitine CoA-transferase CaiB-like acyl-CoA transferase